MKKKKILIIIIAIVLILIISIIVGVIFFHNIHPTEQEECIPFTGGGYTLLFDTNGGEKLDSIHVCIACSPDSYEEIPTPTKGNDTFEGWYYDENFKKKVTDTSSKDITPIPKKNAKGCMIGYEDITLYAKWSNSKAEEEEKDKKEDTTKETKKSTKKESEKQSATKVIDAIVSYACEHGELIENNRCRTGKTLPPTGGDCPANSTYMIVLDSCVETTYDDEETCASRGGYIEFGSTRCIIDHGRPTQFTCAGDAAGWELVNNAYCEQIEDAKIVYSCPEGYTLNGTKCSK